MLKRKTEIPGLEYLSDLDCSVRPPVALSHRSPYNHFTAADEKIPLPVVHVNNKPQDIVFPSHSRHLPAKQRPSPVESGKSPCAMSIWRLKFCPDSCAKRDILRSAPCQVPNLKPSLRAASKQGAKPVQFTPETVRTVDNCAHLLDDSQARPASAFGGRKRRRRRTRSAPDRLTV
jgi:hypothetical protein